MTPAIRVVMRPPMNQIIIVTVHSWDKGCRDEERGGSVLRSTGEKRGTCVSVVCHQMCTALCEKDDNTSTGTVIPAKRPLLSEDAYKRHKMGKDAKQLAGKLTASTVTVWKYFNKLETISKMVDSSDSVRRQRPALWGLSVYFSSLIKFTAKRQATGDRPQCSPPVVSVAPLPLWPPKATPSPGAC